MGAPFHIVYINKLFNLYDYSIFLPLFINIRKLTSDFNVIGLKIESVDKELILSKYSSSYISGLLPQETSLARLPTSAQGLISYLESIREQLGQSDILPAIYVYSGSWKDAYYRSHAFIYALAADKSSGDKGNILYVRLKSRFKSGRHRDYRDYRVWHILLFSDNSSFNKLYNMFRDSESIIINIDNEHNVIDLSVFPLRYQLDGSVKKMFVSYPLYINMSIENIDLSSSRSGWPSRILSSSYVSKMVGGKLEVKPILKGYKPFYSRNNRKIDFKFPVYDVVPSSGVISQSVSRKGGWYRGGEIKNAIRNYDIIYGAFFDDALKVSTIINNIDNIYNYLQNVVKCEFIRALEYLNKIFNKDFYKENNILMVFSLSGRDLMDVVNTKLLDINKVYVKVYFSGGKNCVEYSSGDSPLIDRKLIVKALLSQPVLFLALSPGYYAVDSHSSGLRLSRFEVKRLSYILSYMRFTDFIILDKNILRLLVGDSVNVKKLIYSFININLSKLNEFNLYYARAWQKIYKKYSYRIRDSVDLYYVDLAAVVLAWLAFLFDYIVSYKFRSNSGEVDRVEINLNYVFTGLAGMILLVGLHTLLHMQNRLVASRLGVSWGRVRERLVLYSNNIKAYIFDYMRSFSSAAEDSGYIIEGGMVILPNAGHGEFSGNRAELETFVLGYPVSTRNIEDLEGLLRIGGAPTSPLCRMLYGTIGGPGPFGDRCLDHWSMQSAQPRSDLVRMFRARLSSSGVSRGRDARAEFEAALSAASPLLRFGGVLNLSDRSTARVARLLYYPTVEVSQKSFERAVGMSDESVKTQLRSYIVHLARTVTPYCWDGCLSCVMEGSEACFVASSVAQQPLVSKSAGELLCRLTSGSG